METIRPVCRVMFYATESHHHRRRVLTTWRSEVSGSREVVLEVAPSLMSRVTVSCFLVPERPPYSIAIPAVWFLHCGLRFIRVLIQVMCLGPFLSQSSKNISGMALMPQSVSIAVLGQKVDLRYAPHASPPNLCFVLEASRVARDGRDTCIRLLWHRIIRQRRDSQGFDSCHMLSVLMNGALWECHVEGCPMKMTSPTSIFSCPIAIRSSREQYLRRGEAPPRCSVTLSPRL